MGLQMKGITNLISKLNNFSNIQAQEAVKEVAEIVAEGIKAEASKFSNNADLIGQVETREYGKNTCFIDIGLKNNKVPFEQWKHLYYHNYGYQQFVFGNDSGEKTTMHQMWFDKAVNSVNRKALKELKDNLREKVKDVLE